MRTPRQTHKPTELAQERADQLAAEKAAASEARRQSLYKMLPSIYAATGTSSPLEGLRRICQVLTAQVSPLSDFDDGRDPTVEGICALGEMSPRSATESMLAVQIIATHEASLMFLHRSTWQATETSEASMRCATRLMRLHLLQVEALEKLQSKPVTIAHTTTRAEPGPHLGPNPHVRYNADK